MLSIRWLPGMGMMKGATEELMFMPDMGWMSMADCGHCSMPLPDGDDAWRNHFVASEGHADMPTLNELLAADYMAVRDNPGGSGYLFRATDKGREAVGADVRA